VVADLHKLAVGREDYTRKVAEAHQAGVQAAVAYFDRQVGTRTGRHGAEHVQGEGLLAVGFTHRTSRAFAAQPGAAGDRGGRQP
jgi:hypothetical protein